MPLSASTALRAHVCRDDRVQSQWDASSGVPDGDHAQTRIPALVKLSVTLLQKVTNSHSFDLALKFLQAWKVYLVIVFERFQSSDLYGGLILNRKI